MDLLERDHSFAEVKDQFETINEERARQRALLEQGQDEEWSNQHDTDADE